MKPPVLAICGPTSSGKSEAAVRIAGMLGGEIVNADSRQVYKFMQLGTGWPDEALLAQVPHHGYGVVEPSKRYSAGRFVEDASAAIEAIQRRGRVAMIVGGTGLYIEALTGTMPLNRPIADDALRARLQREATVHPQTALYDWLRAIASRAAKRVRPNDRYRTLRALEETLTTRDFLDGRSKDRPRRKKIAMRIFLLQVEHDRLGARIERRVRAMFDAGLVEEAVDVAARFEGAPALTGLGYGEALALHRGLATRREAIDSTVRRTKQYAKRQQTWFRRMRDAIVVDATDINAAVAAICNMAGESSLPA